MSKKPVITNETAKEIVNALRANNVGQREIRDLLSEQLMVGSAYPVAMISVSYDGTSYALDGYTVDDIKNALASGVTPVLKIVHDNLAYFIPYSRMVDYNGIVAYQFDTDRNCPDGKFGMFIVFEESGAVTKSESYSPTADCKNVVIKIDSAFGILTAENKADARAREKERWRFAKSLCGGV